MAGPSSEDSLLALVIKAHAAQKKCRWARTADVFKRAALQASVLYPHDLLLIVELQFHHADALYRQAEQPGLSFVEQVALHEEAWALVQEGMEVVSRRHASDTLGYNKCWPDEVQYVTRRVTSRILGEDDTGQHGPLRLAFTASTASCIGISVALLHARSCLIRLHSRSFGVPLPPLAAPECGLAEQFVIRMLDYLASTRAVTIPIVGEAELVYVVQQILSVAVMEPSFRAVLEARWTSPDVVACLHMRGILDYSSTLIDHFGSEREAAHRADVAEHGLLVCALPGCDKREVTVREFKVCSACRAVAYCSAEHGGLHWAGGNKHVCNDLKAAGAKPARAV